MPHNCHALQAQFRQHAKYACLAVNGDVQVLLWTGAS